MSNPGFFHTSFRAYAEGQKEGYEAGLRRAAEIARAYREDQPDTIACIGRNQAIAAAIEAEIAKENKG